MRLKSLELCGFKSFVDKTVVNFDAGVSAIVGPNGSGKSNCVDAIRWAMGEQSAKHLRGREMQDVIFSGNDKRPPVGMARVALTFDVSDGRAPAGFSDYSEIQVERRLYRSGESEYFINQVPCRLRDIIDLFLGTGVGTRAYSIIEQGKVDQILSSKPEERRNLIEEAAGISKFKARKESALRKMEATETNLARLRDIIAELERQLNSLNRQAKKAERYKQVYDELKSREVRLAGIKHRHFQGELDRLLVEKSRSEEGHVQLEAKVGEIEAKREEERLQLATIENDLNRVQEDFYKTQNTVKLSEAAIEFQNQKLKDLAVTIEKEGKELELFGEKLKTVLAEIETLNQKKVEEDVALASVEAVAVEKRKIFEEAAALCTLWQERIQMISKEVLEAVGASAESQSRIEYLEKQEVELSGEIAKHQAEIEVIDQFIKGLSENITASDLRLTDLKQASGTLATQSAELRSALEQKKSAVEQAQHELQSRRDDLAVFLSRQNSLRDLQNNHEGFSDGVKAVLGAAQQELRGVRGTVSDVVETSADYESAVSALLGDRLQYVVVESSEQGVDALQHVKGRSRGRTTFIPLNVQNSSSGRIKGREPGLVGPLLEKVRFADDYKRIAEFLFSDCLLVEDLQTALRFWQRGNLVQTLVTLSGEVVDPKGLISGGTIDSDASLLSLKRRIDELDQQIAYARGMAGEAEQRTEGLRIEVKQLEEKLDLLNREYHGEEIRFAHQEKDGARLYEELARYQQDRDRVAVAIARSIEEQGEVKDQKRLSKEQLAEWNLKQQDLESESRQLRQKLEEAMKNRERLAEEATIAKEGFARQTETTALRERELERSVQQKLELAEGMEQRRLDIRLAQEQTHELTRANVAERTKLETALKQLDSLKTSQLQHQQNYESLAKAIQEKEVGLREQRKRLETIIESSHQTEMKIAEFSHQLQSLNDQLRERYQLDASSLEISANDAESLNLEEESAQVTALKDKLNNLGAVHVGALEEYSDLKQRFDFLAKQEADLAQSLEDLKKAIARLNKISRERFQETFELVNAKFQEIFPRLFKGGRAKLELIAGETLLESGVEIFAQPPGKKLQALTLLSGGEKALTAVALIFSIFLIKPSPFCLLDEVDAPLDDANVDRFNDMIRDFTAYSQFIVITHNKRTMEKSDCLYGVTMQEAGVSNIVTVRLNQTPEALPKVA